MGADDSLEQLLGGQVQLDVHLVTSVTKSVQAGVGDLFGDQNSHGAILPAVPGPGQPSTRPGRPGVPSFPP